MSVNGIKDSSLEFIEIIISYKNFNYTNLIREIGINLKIIQDI